MSERIYIKSVSSSGDSDKIRFIMHMSDGRQFSCWLDNMFFNVMIQDTGDNFDVYTTDISVLEGAVYLVANGHFQKSIEYTYDHPITEEMLDVVADALEVENKRNENK